MLAEVSASTEDLRHKLTCLRHLVHLVGEWLKYRICDFLVNDFHEFFTPFKNTTQSRDTGQHARQFRK